MPLPDPAELTLCLPWGRVAALRLGTPGGRPVLALHGWLDNAASFIPLAAHLAPDWDIVAVDLPGHGHSDWLPAGQPYLLPFAVPQVLDIADALGWGTFDLMGHSMGGALGCLVAAAAPQRIGRLACIEALGPLADTGDTVERLQRFVQSSRTPARPRRLAASPDVLVQLRMAHNGLDQCSARLLVERGSEVVDGQWRWCSDPALTRPAPSYLAEPQVMALLGAITCPVHVVLAHDGRVPAARALQRQSALQQAHVAWIEGGHHVHLTAPRQTAQALQALGFDPAER